MENYKVQKVIGDGSFGTVSKATHVKTGEIVAIKKMKKKFYSWDECINLRELKSLRKLVHPNIIKLKEAMKVNDELHFVFEYLDQNVFQLYSGARDAGKTLTEDEIRSVIYQCALGLGYMHKHGFFHRDLKPENLLIHNGSVKIADFGLAREIRSRPPYTEYVATRWYRAPEILLKSSNYNSPVDIFALGCIMAELYTFSPLFKGASEMDQLFKVCGILGTPTQSNWGEGFRLATQSGYSFPQCPSVPLKSIIPNACDEAISLLYEMLKYDPNKRISAQGILQHPYFANFTYIEKPLTPQIAEGTRAQLGGRLNSRHADPEKKIGSVPVHSSKVLTENPGTKANIFVDTSTTKNLDSDLLSMPSALEIHKRDSSKKVDIRAMKRGNPLVNPLSNEATLNTLNGTSMARDETRNRSPLKEGVIMDTKKIEDEINETLQGLKLELPKQESAQSKRPLLNASSSSSSLAMQNSNNILNFNNAPNNMNMNMNTFNMDIGLSGPSKPFMPLISGSSQKIQLGQLKYGIQNIERVGRFEMPSASEKPIIKNQIPLGPSAYDFMAKKTSLVLNSINKVPENQTSMYGRQRSQSPLDGLNNETNMGTIPINHNQIGYGNSYGVPSQLSNPTNTSGMSYGGHGTQFPNNKFTTLGSNQLKGEMMGNNFSSSAKLGEMSTRLIGYKFDGNNY